MRKSLLKRYQPKNKNDTKEIEDDCIEGICEGSILFPLISFTLWLQVQSKCIMIHTWKEETKESHGLEEVEGIDRDYISK